jgi:hypothetical protein
VIRLSKKGLEVHVILQNGLIAGQREHAKPVTKIF